MVESAPVQSTRSIESPNLSDPVIAEAAQPVEPPEIFIDHMTLYHGSAKSGIQAMRPADEFTIGTGLYLTDSPNDAAGYARRSSHNQQAPQGYVYEVDVDGMRIVNLDSPQKLQEVMTGFAGALEETLANLDPNDWIHREALNRAIQTARLGVTPGRVQDVTQSCSDLFSRYLSGQGYDGLKALEGGEAGYVGNHTSYVIFDPNRTKVESEHTVPPEAVQ